MYRILGLCYIDQFTTKWYIVNDECLDKLTAQERIDAIMSTDKKGRKYPPNKYLDLKALKENSLEYKEHLENLELKLLLLN